MGAPLAWVWGVRGRALSQPRLPALCAGCRGPLPTGCGCGGVRAWGPVTDPTARAIASWLCALWGRHEVARGGRLLPGWGASGVGRSPNPDCPPSGRAAGAHYPLDSGHARQATVKCGRERQEGDRVATGRRQGGDRKTTGQRQESGREATGSDRQATGIHEYNELTYFFLAACVLHNCQIQFDLQNGCEPTAERPCKCA